MIQILALREASTPGKKVEVWFERGMRATSVESIFSDPLTPIKTQTTMSERFNLYYTVAECLEEKGRKLSIQHHIPFDIDGIDVPENPDVHLEGIARIVCSTLGVKYEETGVLFSGNGVQLLVGTTHPITDVSYFDAARKYYKACAENINNALLKAKINGKTDTSVWSPARLFRYPGTYNRKPNKPERLSRILQSNIVRVDFRLEVASNLPSLTAADYVNQEVAATFPTPDVATIMKECDFLKWAQLFPEKVSEPQWYAALSLTSRFPEGRNFSHKMSEGHPSYSFHETETKIDQALEHAGPRTCSNINTLSDKCRSCVHFGKLTTPLLIEGPDHIKTEKNGFYDILINDEGKVRRGKPNYHDLYKKFKTVHKYKVTYEGMFYTWNGTHYEPYNRTQVEQFAEEKFDPKPNGNMRREFWQKVKLYNLVDPDWFNKTSEGRMNFKNCVLNLRDGSVLPQTPDIGFRTTLPCEYLPTAEAPRFMQFMRDITCNRPDLIAILQEFMGYIFSGSNCKFDKALVLLGTGENGKSTFVKVLRELLGEASSNLSLGALYDPQNRALLEGKLCNIAEENNKNSFKDTELIKNLASGGVVHVKRVYVEPYEFQNTAKIVMLCNELPRSLDATHGFFRKLLIVPFDALFSKKLGNRDNDLTNKLLAELPGIFNWAMEGYKRLIEQDGFTESVSGEEKLQEYKQEVSPFIAWFNENCEVSNDDKVEYNRQELYNHFTQWCQSNGEKYVPAMREFLTFLRVRVKGQIGKIPQDRKRGKDGYRFWAVSNVILGQKADF